MTNMANIVYIEGTGLNLHDALQRGGALELMGRDEAARALHCKAANLRTLKGLPEPVVDYLPRRPLWLASEIHEFAQRSGRAR